jgi:hypothetical protein
MPIQNLHSYLGARLRGLQGRVCFQWVPALRGLFGNKRADEEKAAGFGPDDRVKRRRISFEVVMGLIWKQVKDGPPNLWHTVLALCTFREHQGGRKSCLLILGVVAPYY